MEITQHKTGVSWILSVYFLLICFYLGLLVAVLWSEDYYLQAKYYHTMMKVCGKTASTVGRYSLHMEKEYWNSINQSRLVD